MAQTADSVIVALEAQLGGFTPKVRAGANDFDQSMTKIERSANRAEASVQRTAVGITRSTDLISQRGRQLGFQFQDIGAQLASGTSPFIILAQQGPQVVNALDGVGGAAGRVAGFFSGPWGAALLAAASVVGVLTANLLNGADAAEKKKAASDGLKDAVDRLNGASASLNNTTVIGIQNDIRAAEALRIREVRTRRQIQAQLELAQANLKGASAAALNPGSGFTPEERAGALGAAGGYEQQVAGLERQRAEQDRKISEAQRAIRAGQAQISLRGVAAATDQAAAATQRYEDRLDFLTRQFERGYISQAQFERGATAATTSRDKALKAVSDAEKTATRATSARNKELRESERAEKRAAAEALRAAKELDTTLDGLIGKLDPARGAASDFAKTLADIERVRLAGLVSDTEAIALKLGAAAVNGKRIAQDNSTFARDNFGTFTTPEDIVAGIEREKELRFRAAEDAARYRLEQERDLAYQVSGYVEDAFSGGFDRVADRFKTDMFAIVAQIVARLALAQFDGQSGTDFGSILSSSIGAIFGGGRASGGPVQGGHLYRVNEGASPGRVEGFRPQGSGTIIPLGQMKAATATAPQQPVIVQVSVKRGEAFEPMVRSISNGQAVEVVRAAAPEIQRSTLAQVPSEQQFASRYGTGRAR